MLKGNFVAFMAIEPIINKEPLDEEELHFLEEKASKDSRLFLYVIKWMIVACVLIPLSYDYYYYGLLFLLLFSGSCVYYSYYLTLRKILKDISFRTKIIECCTIKRKHFMSLNNTYHFYIHSSQKLSIQVSETDYNRLNEGDEVSIEYTEFSKMYLGYF